MSDEAYDRKVAGILSGAGGVKPGMLMAQKGSEADGADPVALTGRVSAKKGGSFWSGSESQGKSDGLLSGASGIICWIGVSISLAELGGGS